MTLYALRSNDDVPKYSQIFPSRGAIEEYIAAHRIIDVTVGLVTFTDICPVRAVIDIPWEEGIGSLENRYQQSGSGDSESPEPSSPVRSEVPAEDGPPARREKKRPKRLLPRNGGARKE